MTGPATRATFRRHRADGASGLVALMIAVGGCAAPDVRSPVAGEEVRREQESNSDGSNLPGRLVLEREKFSYPGHGRRDPFQPLAENPLDGDAVAGLRILGIVHHEIPRYSLVVLRTGTNAGGDTGAGGPGAVEPSTHRLRAGDSLGALRIVQVRLREVVVDVMERGGITRRILRVSPLTGREGT